MGALEKVMQMKGQGLPEDEIIKQLQNDGTSPKEILDALTQSQIKSAILDQDVNEMEPSIMGSSLSEVKKPEAKPKEQVPEDIYNPQMPQQNYPQYNQQVQESGEEYYQQEEYSGEYASAEGSVDSIIEISEQVFLEKIKKVQNQISEFSEFKNIAQVKLDNIDERLKRIEKMFDQMQVSIIQKVGNYGKGLETLKKEIEMVEDSFAKTIEKDLDKKINSKKKK